MTQLDDDTLQRYYDGELSPVEERAVRARVDADPDARARLAKLARLSELFQMAGEEMGAEVDSEALFAGIQGGLKQQAELGLGARLSLVKDEWLEHRRGMVMTLIGTTAVAAAALLTVLVPHGDATQVASAPATTLGQPAVHGSKVENVDFGSNTGTVFEIESKGVTTAVVWIADDDDEEQSQ
jgi:anti-sigma factor RsiW